MRFVRTKLFYTSRRPLLIAFTTKLYLRSEHRYHSNFMHCTTKEGFYTWDFLFVRIKRHARVRSIFSSYQVMG